LPGRRGHLQPDPAGPDDGDRAAVPGRLAEVGQQRVRLVDRAEITHTRQVSPGHFQPSYSRAGRQQQLVVVQRGDAVECDRVGGRVEVGDPGAEAQVDVVLPVPV